MESKNNNVDVGSYGAPTKIKDNIKIFKVDDTLFSSQEEFYFRFREKKGEVLSLIEFFVEEGDTVEQLLSISKFSNEYTSSTRDLRSRVFRKEDGDILTLMSENYSLDEDSFYSILAENRTDKACSEVLYKENDSQASYSVVYNSTVDKCFFKVKLLDSTSNFNNFRVKSKFDDLINNSRLTKWSSLAECAYFAYSTPGRNSKPAYL